MDVAVDQAGRKSGAVRINHARCAFGVQLLFAANRGDAPVFCDNGVGLENRPLQVSAQQQADITNYEFRAYHLLDTFFVSHRFAASLLTRLPARAASIP